MNAFLAATSAKLALTEHHERHARYVQIQQKRQRALTAVLTVSNRSSARGCIHSSLILCAAATDGASQF